MLRLNAAHSFSQVPLLAAAVPGISSTPAATTSTSCCLDPSRQFHRTGEHAGRQTQLERRPAISIMLILVEMYSTKFNLFQDIFSLELQFISTYCNRELRFLSTYFNQEFQFISIDYSPDFQFISTCFNIMLQRISMYSTHFWAKIR